MKEYDLYVPLRSNNGKRFPSAELARLKKILIKRFGGLTLFPQAHQGFWRIGTATFRDEIVILRVLADEYVGDSRFWRNLKRDLKKRWGQQEVLVVVKKVTTV